MALPVGPTSLGGSSVHGRLAAIATTLIALATVMGTLPEDPIAAFERVLPAWLIAFEVAAATTIVAAAWITSLSRPGITIGLAVAAVGLFVPVWAGWAWLPAGLRAAAVAAAPLAVAGAAHVGLVWTVDGRRNRMRWVVDILALVAALTIVAGYDPLADPSCLRACVHAQTAFGSLVATRTAVLIAAILAVAAAAVAALALVKVMVRSAREPVQGAALAATVSLAAGWILWIATWGRMPEAFVLVLPTVVAAAIIGVGTLAGGLAIGRTRAAAGRLAARLRDPDPFAPEPGGRIREVHFAVPGEDRWVDATGRPVEAVQAVGRPIVISDGDDPIVRLVVGRDDDPSDVLAGLTPATGLAVRNGQLAAVVHARVAEVQASRRRIVSASDAERRRIERDLHDGAQQRLVSAAFHLSVVRGRQGDDQLALGRAEQALRVALGRLRQLAHGIFPSVLATEGLSAALEELVLASRLPATLEAEPVKVDPETAMAAYSIVAAVLGHAADGSAAPAIHVAVARQGDELIVAVDAPEDVRLDDPGLVDVTDRIGAVGGSVSIEGRQSGVSLIAVMPCVSS